jgi:hypothetical protein
MSMGQLQHQADNYSMGPRGELWLHGDIAHLAV